MDADYQEVIKYAQNQLEEEIAKELVCASRLVDKKLTHEKTDEKTVRVTLTMEFIENQEKRLIFLRFGDIINRTKFRFEKSGVYYV